MEGESLRLPKAHWRLFLFVHNVTPWARNVEPRVESPMSNVDDRNDPCALVAVVISEPDCPSPRIDPAVGYDEQRSREARLEPRYSDEHDGQLMMALHVAVVISESDGR